VSIQACTLERTTATSRLCGEVTLAINSNKQLRATNDSQHELLIIARKSTYSMHCRTHSERLLVDTYHRPTTAQDTKRFLQKLQRESMMRGRLLHLTYDRHLRYFVEPFLEIFSPLHLSKRYKNKGLLRMVLLVH
jgi:hypothetical protein